MKLYLIILTFLSSQIAIAEPWDKLVNELTSKNTITELKTAKANFYSRIERSPLTRYLGFGFDHTTWEFDYVHGNSSTDFVLSLISKNDSIVFGRLERINWKDKIEQVYEFGVYSEQLSELIKNYNSFYLTHYSLTPFIEELTADYYFSLGCGETGSDQPKQADQMLKWSRNNKVNKLTEWLKSPNFELQAYAIEGLRRIQDSGEKLPPEVDRIIEYLKKQNNLIVNCTGCLMGLETPLNQLIFEK